LTSRTRECAKLGVDFLEIVREIAAEQKAAADLGVTLGASPADAAATQQLVDQQSQQEDTPADSARVDAELDQALVVFASRNGNDHNRIAPFLGIGGT
jgi:hypothetical protein